MRKIDKYLIVMVGLLLPFGISAQVHIGITTGLNSTFVLDKGLSEDPRYNSQMTYNFAPVGFSFGADLGNSFGLQLESIFANQGQIFEILDVAKNVVGERRIDVSYIQLPLFFKFMSGNSNRARPNFSIGPQLSILRSGLETIQYDASTQNINNIADVPQGAIQNPDGSYNVAALQETEILSSTASDELRKFSNKELQIAASFGLDIDIAKNLFLTTLIRANYSLTDMRNGDLVDFLKENDVNDIFSRRANLAIGAQIGINFMFNGVRSFKDKKLNKSE